MDELSNLEIFFESSPDLLCIAGHDGYFKKINAAVSHVLGYTMDELFSLPIEFFMYHEDRELTLRKRQELIAGGVLLNFDNRYVTKSGAVVWLTWTSVPIKGKKLIFAIAKDITAKKKAEESRGEKVTSGNEEINAVDNIAIIPSPYMDRTEPISYADQIWLSKLEALIRKYTGQVEVTISMLSDEMAISERQLFRRIKTIVGLTPNKYIRTIRLQLAREALKTGKFRTVSEVSFAAGFKTPGYFSKLFKDVYGAEITDFTR